MAVSLGEMKKGILPKIPLSLPVRADGEGREAAGLAGFSGLLGSSFSWYRKVFSKLLPFFLLFFSIQVVLVVLEFLSHTVKDLQLFAILLGSLIAITFVRWVVFSFFFPITVFVILKRMAANESVSFFTVLKRSFFYFFPFLLVTTILALELAGSLVLFILPALFLFMYLALSAASVVLEDRHGFDALLRSWGLVRGSWIRVFSSFLVLGFLIMMLFVFLNIPAVLFSSWVNNSITIPKDVPITYYVPDLLNLLRLVEAVYTLWGNVIELVLIPFPLIFTYVLFQDLKTAKGEVVAPEKRSILQALLVLGVLAVLFYLIVANNLTLFSVWAKFFSP